MPERVFLKARKEKRAAIDMNLERRWRRRARAGNAAGKLEGAMRTLGGPWRLEQFMQDPCFLKNRSRLNAGKEKGLSLPAPAKMLTGVAVPT